MRGAILAGCLVLAGCGADSAPDELSLKLQPIGAPEMEQYDIAAGGCAFVPEGGGLGSVFVQNEDTAFIKVDGRVIKLAKMPVRGLHKPYGGGGYSALLIQGRLTVKQGIELVYAADGIARCAA